MATDWIDGYLADRKKEESIWCPHCGELFEDEDYGHVTYWGDDREQYKSEQCASCGLPFLVLESVRRTYETEKKVPEKNSAKKERLKP